MKGQRRGGLGPRWVERGPGGAIDDRIGELLRQVPGPAALPEAGIERVAARLGRERPRRRGLPALRWVVVSSVLLGTGGVVFARHELARLIATVAGRATPTPTPTPAPSARRPSRAASPPRATTPTPLSTASEPPAPATPPAAPAHALTGTPARAPASSAGGTPAPRAATPALAPSPTGMPARAGGAAPPAAPPPAPASPSPVAHAEGPPTGRGLPSIAGVRPRSLAANEPPVPPAAPRSLAPAPSMAAAPRAVAAPVGASEPATPPPAPAPRPLPSAPAIAAAAPPGLGEEAQLVRRALERLRRDRDPAAALAALDEHQARFPRGLLRADADLVRIEALLAQRRDGEALALLTPLELVAGPRRDELLVTRAELRAARDCDSALVDLDRALAHPLPDALAERALRGRAICRLRAGAAAPAEADLRAYLARFPQGAFAAEARARLQAPR